MESELILSQGGLPPLSARGCTQRLMPLGSGSLRRTVNGSLVYTGTSKVHKYRSVISCEDKAAMALDGIWRGSAIRVGCIQRLWQKVEGREIVLERDPVDGSIRIIDQYQEGGDIQDVVRRTITLASSPLEQTFVSYRPWLDMRVVTFCLSTDEWGLKAGWRLELEEI